MARRNSLEINHTELERKQLILYACVLLPADMETVIELIGSKITVFCKFWGFSFTYGE